MEAMKPVVRLKKVRTILNFVVGLLLSVSAIAQSVGPDQKMPVGERMAKARAAKADKKETKAADRDSRGTMTTQNGRAADNGTVQTYPDRKEEKATPADYKAPVVKAQKGPNGEVVYTGERGGQYYINKNGNKTYLSSNQ